MIGNGLEGPHAENERLRIRIEELEEENRSLKQEIRTFEKECDWLKSNPFTYTADR